MRRNESKNGSLKARVKPVPVQVALNRAVRRVNRMTQSELRQSLIDCGIVTHRGKLAPMYR